MSSTARGTQRNDNDYYVTPQQTINEFLDQFEKDYDFNPEGKFGLDPCAGGCEKYEMAYPKALKAKGFNLHSVDIRADSRADYVCVDYLEKPFKQLHSFIITNPPFLIATEFAEKAFNEVFEGGYVVFLNRLNWLGSKKRKTFWNKAPLKHIYVHSKRPGFNPEKPNSTDSIEYAHFVFQRGYVGPSHISII